MKKPECRNCKFSSVIEEDLYEKAKVYNEVMSRKDIIRAEKREILSQKKLDVSSVGMAYFETISKRGNEAIFVACENEEQAKEVSSLIGVEVQKVVRKYYFSCPCFEERIE